MAKPGKVTQRPPRGPSFPRKGKQPCWIHAVAVIHRPLWSSKCFLHSIHCWSDLPASHAHLPQKLDRRHWHLVPAALPPSRTPAAQTNGSSHRPPKLPTWYRVCAGGHSLERRHSPFVISIGLLQAEHCTRCPRGLGTNSLPGAGIFRTLHFLHVRRIDVLFTRSLQLHGSCVFSNTLPNPHFSSCLHEPLVSHDALWHLMQVAPVREIRLAMQSPRVLGDLQLCATESNSHTPSSWMHARPYGRSPTARRPAPVQTRASETHRPARRYIEFLHRWQRFSAPHL